MAPDHKKILAETSQHLDDLQIRNPSAYRFEEEHLKRDNARLGVKVAQSPAFIRRKEKLP